ncbi:MAG: Ig domain-containing protein [Christensenellaceae bacterium]|nr:Ig domain-containing protein [Christensenellaceae bacterium]
MKFKAFVTSIILLAAMIISPLSSVYAKQSIADSNGQETTTTPIEMTQQLDPAMVAPRSVFFHKEELSAELGSQIDINVNMAVYPETANLRDMTFETSNRSVAVIDENGIITARGKGECTLSATTVNGKTASMTLTVFGTDVTGISIEPSEEKVYAYDTVTLKATIAPEDASVKRVKWSSSDSEVATVDANGVVTCKMPGYTVITATAFGGKSVLYLLTVYEREVTDIVLLPEAYEGKKGERFDLNAKVYPENATFKNLTYTSSNPKVAYVDKSGQVLFKSKGSAIITVESKSGVSVGYSVKCTKTFKSVHFRQGDTRWKFSKEVKKKACLITAFAMLLYNNGIDATPRTAYNVGGTGTNLDRLTKKFPVKCVSAVDSKSEYFDHYDGKTFIKNPAKNAIPAIKEALDKNPEGVIAYFKRGDEAHAVVAIGYIDDTIYYSDPGRAYSKGFDVPLSGTWVYAGHRMGYRNLAYIVAIDTVED